MAYTMDFSLLLGAGLAGLVDLRAQITDTAGVNVGAAIATGFVDMGTGCYLWHYAAFPDGQRGGVKFYRNAFPAVTLAFAAVNPEEAENTDVKTSTRAIAGDAMALTAGAVDAILDEVVEGAYTMRQYLRLFAAMLLGKATGGGTATIVFRNTGDTLDRVTMTVDVNGNRSAVTLVP